MSRFVTCAVLIAASFLATGPAHSANNVFAGSIGQHGFMGSDWYICSSWDVYKRYDKLMKDDAVAALALADRDCTKVRDQTEVVVEDTSNFNLWSPNHGAICVRPIGSPDCGWVLPGAVMLADCKPFYKLKDPDMRAKMMCVAREHPDNPQRPWSFGYAGD
jgi:hypothetical protein